MIEPNRTVERLVHFDKIFGTKTIKNIKSLPLIRVFYTYFKEKILVPEEENKKLIEKRDEILNKLQLTEEQQKIFNEYKEIDNKINDEFGKQAFTFGYLTFAEFHVEFEECINKEEIYNKVIQKKKENE